MSWLNDAVSCTVANMLLGDAVIGRQIVLIRTQKYVRKYRAAAQFRGFFWLKKVYYNI